MAYRSYGAMPSALAGGMLDKGEILYQVPELLLVDDDSAFCQSLSRYLEERGFSVTIENSGEAESLVTMTGRYDLVLLNEHLPGSNGIEILRRIRVKRDLPVVMLSASKDAIDAIVALELGADDFLSKSCHMRELVARLRSILRRARRPMTSVMKSTQNRASLRLSASKCAATWRGKRLKLTSTEFKLLALLSQHFGRVVCNSELALSGLGRELKSCDRSLVTHITHLRRKMGRLADGRSPIRNVRGVGYQLLGE